ncbi:MAG: 6-phosphogluconolactonase [Candidatus Nitricoxidivorans perseverans]|uniref:6-phosphogluconolactonase n=1 Tax=Candidatus Nitricoxidivorans perseverans TaxID=2975601 RepID=A0AA49FLY7_9PROT|nr:MAG: 6-phosphogluconolactonase [Candidatus Nitricoxidivorans perseverans]
MTQGRQFCRWHPHDDAEAMARAVAAEVLRAAEDALRQRDEFHIVLAGGNTPRRAYEALRNADAGWSGWHVWFGDERCLPPGDPERNSRMAGEAWLDHVPIPERQIHAIPAERGAAAAVAAYAEALKGRGDFDLVLLGLGEDGHTASLFPGHDWGAEPDAPDALAIFDALKPPAERVSLSARRLSRARRVFFLAGGAGKRAALSAWRGGEGIPASAITPRAGVDVYFEAGR